MRRLINKFYRLPVSVPRLMIEVTDKCNLACSFCSNKDINREKHDIPEEIFYKAVNQYIQMGGRVLRPYSTGEPLMCKRFPEYLAYAHRKGLGIRFTSNGLLLTEEISKQILKNGAQNINISVEGLNKSEYESIRTGGNFDRLRDNLSSFLAMRKQMGLAHPTIRIQTILFKHQENKTYMGEFRRVWDEFCDSIIFTQYGTQGGNQIRNCKIVPMKDRIICKYFFNLLCVNNDGSVSCCCVDYQHKLIVGDLTFQTLQEIWKGQKLADFRKLARKRAYEEIAPVCTLCSSISQQADRDFQELNCVSNP